MNNPTWVKKQEYEFEASAREILQFLFPDDKKREWRFNQTERMGIELTLSPAAPTYDATEGIVGLISVFWGPYVDYVEAQSMAVLNSTEAKIAKSLSFCTDPQRMFGIALQSVKRGVCRAELWVETRNDLEAFHPAIAPTVGTWVEICDDIEVLSTPTAAAHKLFYACLKIVILSTWESFKSDIEKHLQQREKKKTPNTRPRIPKVQHRRALLLALHKNPQYQDHTMPQLATALRLLLEKESKLTHDEEAKFTAEEIANIDATTVENDFRFMKKNGIGEW